MSDELENVQEAPGVGRRDFLRRSAIVGGMVWAAPIISSAPAFAQGFTPDDEEDPNGQDISYLAFVLHNDGALRYKYEDKGGTCKLEKGGENKPCEDSLSAAQKSAWDGAAAGGSADGKVSVNCSNDTVWTITPAANYGVLFAVVKSGSANPCSVFDNSGAVNGYPKGVAVNVFQK